MPLTIFLFDFELSFGKYLRLFVYIEGLFSGSGVWNSDHVANLLLDSTVNYEVFQCQRSLPEPTQCKTVLHPIRLVD